MLDDLLAIGCIFDWITPTAALIESALRGSSRTLSVPLETGMGRNEVRDLLRHYGIRAWGMMYCGDHILLSVPEKQADFAQHILSQGFYSSPPPMTAAASHNVAHANSTKKKHRNGDAMSQIFDMLDSLGDSITRG